VNRCPAIQGLIEDGIKEGMIEGENRLLSLIRLLTPGS